MTTVQEKKQHPFVVADIGHRHGARTYRDSRPADRGTDRQRLLYPNGLADCDRGMPSDAPAKTLERVLTFAGDHRPRAPSTSAFRMAAPSRIGLNTVVTTALNMLGDARDGAGKQCAELGCAIKGCIDNGISLDDSVTDGLDWWREQYGKIVKGFGPRFDKPVDPRAPRLMEVVRRQAPEGSADGPFADIGEAVQGPRGRQRGGRPIAVNIDGAAAMICHDLGSPSPSARGLFRLWRAVGTWFTSGRERGKAVAIKAGCRQDIFGLANDRSATDPVVNSAFRKSS